jgi:hypothetical protein
MEKTKLTPEKEREAIQAAKLRKGVNCPLLVIRAADGDEDGPTLAFRRPTPAEWVRYRTDALNPDPAVKARAFALLVVPCLVYPDEPVLQAILEDRPGLMEVCGGELVEYAGAERAKKVERL